MANHEVPLEAHPYAFHICGPSNLTTFNWRNLISSSWKDANYKRTVIACLIQAVYLLELDRQEKRTQENALAPNWWTPFKYKLTQTLIDERDGSIFGAIFEWDRSAAWEDLVPIRPRGAPRAVLALRGTLLESPTRRRDIEDDLRFFAWESLKGSVRFKVALEVVKSVSDTYGSSNICIVGHSLGAGFAFQVGKVLAKEGIYVDTHLFNPPSVSLAMSMGSIGEKAQYVWNRLKSVLPSSSKAQISNDEDKTSAVRLKSWMHRLSGLKDTGFGVGKWVPHLYINNNDYICWYYIDPVATGEKIADKEKLNPTNGQIEAKLFVVSKEKQKFLEAHSLEQWWSSDAEPQQAIHNSKLISRQLRSLYSGTPSEATHLFNPPSVSLALSLQNIGETTEFVWNRLISVLPSSIEAQVSNDVDKTSGVGLKSWIPQLSGLNYAGFGVCKWVHHLYVNKSDYICCFYTNPNGTEEKIVDKENMGPANGPIAAQLFVVSKGKQNFLLAHGLEQWWSSDAELQQAIHNNKLFSRQLRSLYTDIPWQVTHLLNPHTVSLAMSLSNIGERAEFVWKWNILKSMLPSNCEAQVSNDGDRTSSARFKSWIPRLSGLKDAGFGVGKWVPHLYINSSDHISWLPRSLYTGTPSQVTYLLSGLKDAGFGVGKWVPHLYINTVDYISRQLRSLYTGTPWQVTHLLNPSFVSLAMSFRKAHCLEHWWSSEAKLQQAIHNSKLISRQLRSLYTVTPSQVTSESQGGAPNKVKYGASELKDEEKSNQPFQQGTPRRKVEHAAALRGNSAFPYLDPRVEGRGADRGGPRRK